jgi:hypothetical protein
MLDGITLLHTFIHTTGVGWVWFAWIGVVLLVAATIYCWLLTTNRRTMVHLIAALIVTLLCFNCFALALNVKPHSETLYKVTIDQSVSYREFTYHYEVINVEGEIYTIREIVHDNYETIPPAPTEEPTETPPSWSTDAVG